MDDRKGWSPVSILRQRLAEAEKRIDSLERLFHMQDRLIHEHNMTKIACSCPPCDAWGKAQDKEDSGWRWENAEGDYTDAERAEIDADVQAGHMY